MIPFFRSSCGNPYRAPTPPLALPSLPTLSTLISRNRNSALPAVPAGMILRMDRSSLSNHSRRFDSAAFSLALTISRSFAARSWGSIRCVCCSWCNLTSSGCGMRSSAGSRFRWNTRPASTRVKCRDSLTGWKSWRIVAR